MRKGNAHAMLEFDLARVTDRFVFWDSQWHARIAARPLVGLRDGGPRRARGRPRHRRPAGSRRAPRRLSVARTGQAASRSLRPRAVVGAVHERISLALERAGLEQRRCGVVATAVRERFVDPSVGWQLFDDTLTALAMVADAGWRNAVLKRRPRAARAGGGAWARPPARRVFSSAMIGYDKPHRRRSGSR